MPDPSSSRRLRVRTLSDRIGRFLAQFERTRRPPSRYPKLQALYEDRPDDSEAALTRAEKVAPLPSHLAAHPVPSDTLSVEALREGLEAIVSRQTEDEVGR